MGNNTSSGGIGFIGLLTIVFITLKLTNYIDWGWIWVLSPIWITVAFYASIFLVPIVVGLLVIGIYELWERYTK